MGESPNTDEAVCRVDGYPKHSAPDEGDESNTLGELIEFALESESPGVKAQRSERLIRIKDRCFAIRSTDHPTADIHSFLSKTDDLPGSVHVNAPNGAIHSSSCYRNPAEFL